MSKQKKRAWTIAGICFLVILAASFFFDKQMIQFVASLRNYYLSQIFFGVKFLDNEILVAVFLTVILLWKKGKREWVFPMWMTILATGIASFILKYSIQRPRPFVQGFVTLLPGLADKASYHTWDFSFPSFDTALTFCAVPIVWKLFPRFRYVWISFAVLVGLSRMYFGVHFMSDVLFGGAMGLLIGILIVREEMKKGSLRRIYHKITKLFSKK